MSEQVSARAFHFSLSLHSHTRPNDDHQTSHQHAELLDQSHMKRLIEEIHDDGVVE